MYHLDVLSQRIELTANIRGSSPTEEDTAIGEGQQQRYWGYLER
jgi:hypothetical protein